MPDPTQSRRVASMLAIRRFEEQLIRLHERGVFSGHFHVYIGQEPTAVALCEQLGPHDMIFTTHRNHGHILARGADPGRLLAEILGRADGYCRGRGGTLHASVAALGVPSTSSLVAGNLPVAVGAALSLKKRAIPGVSVAFFGDGTLEEGASYEAFNLAAVWRVPVLLVCENNSFASGREGQGEVEAAGNDRAPTSTLAARQLSDIPRALSIPSEMVDGAQVEHLWAVLAETVAAVRAEGVPRFLEVRYRRWPGSSGTWPHLAGGAMDVGWAWGDPAPPGEIAGWVATDDPLSAYLRTLVEDGALSPADVRALDREVREGVDHAVAFAQGSPYPDPAGVWDGVFAEGGR